jgi:hypothetical protein
MKPDAAGLASLSGKTTAIADRDLTTPKTGEAVICAVLDAGLDLR